MNKICLVIIYNLSEVPLSWLAGKLPMPTADEMLLANMNHIEEKQFVHSTFYYEKEGGSQFLADTLARDIDVRVDHPVVSLARTENGWFVDGQSFDAVIFCGNLKGGYTPIIEKLLDGCEVRLNTDWKDIKSSTSHFSLFTSHSPKVLFTGPIDEYYDYACGPLEYRSLRFEHERHNETDNLQGVAVMNYTDSSVPYTRTIEHKHFEFGTQPFTIVSKEYSMEWNPGIEPYYPVNDAKNQARYAEYAARAASENRVIFGGCLGLYRYTDMQDAIGDALSLVSSLNVKEV